MMKKTIQAGLLLVAGLCMATTVQAKSLYAIGDINAWPNTPFQAFNINPDGTLTFQTQHNLPTRDGGAVGVGFIPKVADPDESWLFVTYEFSGVMEMINGTTMTSVGQVTAPGAVNLAGIVGDRDVNKVYTVDRYTDNLYVYTWDEGTTTLTLDAQYDLPGIVGGTIGGAFGIALDEANDILYVALNTTDVNYYNTADFTTLAGTITLSRSAIGIAVDVSRGYLYTGAGWYSNEYLGQYNLATSAEAEVHLGAGVGVMGVTVDPDTGNVYCTSGYSSDDLRAFDMALNQIDTEPMPGDPTGLCVTGGKGVNPLALDKDDGLGEGCVNAGANITYDICFDNLNNEYDVHNVTIVDDLPAEINFVSATGGGAYDPGTSTVTWDIGTVLAGAQQACEQLVVQVDAATPPLTEITNYATIDSDETPVTTVDETTEVCEVESCLIVTAWACLSPQCYPILSRGETMNYWLRVENVCDTTECFDGWTNVTLPSGNTYPGCGILHCFPNTRVPPHSTKTLPQTLDIPMNAPLGWYMFNVFAGDKYPNVDTEAHFDFVVTGAPE